MFSAPKRLLLSRSSVLGSFLGLCSLALTGCGSSRSLPAQLSVTPFADVSGNWILAPQAASPGSQLPALAGSLTSHGNDISGTFRIAGPSSCLDRNANILVNGEMDAKGKVQLTSQPIAGTVYALSGQVSPDGKSIAAASYTLKGGACPADSGAAGATQYTSISGNYVGSFTDTTGATVAVSTMLTQTTAPDGNGQFHLSGNAQFANNPCFSSPAITDSLVTGNALSASYSQTNGGVTSTVTAVGTFNTDATVLTITSYAIQGGLCDGDSGTGVLTQQQAPLP